MTMIIDPDSFEGTKDIDVTWRIADVEIDNIKALSDLKMTGTLTRSDDRYSIRANINGIVEVDCVRCLNAYQTSLDIDITAVYVRPESFDDGPDTELESDSGDLDIDILPEAGIDTDSIIREHVLVEMPFKTLCEADCKGLCEQCGADLNITDCDCGQDDIDPRWAALKNFK